MYHCQCRIFVRSYLKHRYYSQRKHPIVKTVESITRDIKSLWNRDSKTLGVIYPEHTDVLVIGAGSIGVAVAYWLKTRTGRGLDVVVLDRGTDKKKCTSFGGLQHHYSLPENILLSQYTAEFLRKPKEHLYSDFNVQFAPHGHLTLASETHANDLENCVAVQKEYGVKNSLLTAERLKQLYPWINSDGIALGCLSLESTGWYDADSLRDIMKMKSEKLGATYYKAEVKDFVLEHQRDVLMEGIAPGTYKRLSKVVYQAEDGQDYEIQFSMCVLAAGAESAQLAKKLGIGVTDGLFTVPLPVVPRKCNVYAFKCNELKLNTPSILDPSGTWLRRDGFTNNFICGQAPLSTFSWREEEHEDEDFTKSAIEHFLIQRIPMLKNLQFDDHWTEDYDYTYYDESGVLGSHCYHNNLYFATGFGNLGIQHAPGIGRAVTELIIDGRFRNTDLTRFGFDRFVTGESIIENRVF